MNFVKLFSSIIFLFIISTRAYCQMVVGGNQAKAMDMNTVPLGTISTFGFAEKVVTGSQLLFDNWRYGTLEVGSNIIKSIPVNIDVKNDLVEINTDKGVRTVSIKSVNSLTISDENLLNKRRFVNASRYNGDKVFVTGLFEVLVDSQTTLLKHHYVYAKEGSYNAALDMGNNETKYIIKARYFLNSTGKNTELPTNKKKFLSLFSEGDKLSLELFIKDNDLNLKDEKDLIAICGFLNQRNIFIISK